MGASLNLEDGKWIFITCAKIDPQIETTWAVLEKSLELSRLSGTQWKPMTDQPRWTQAMLEERQR